MLVFTNVNTFNLSDEVIEKCIMDLGLVYSDHVVVKDAIFDDYGFHVTIEIASALRNMISINFVLTLDKLTISFYVSRPDTWGYIYTPRVMDVERVASSSESIVTLLSEGYQTVFGFLPGLEDDMLGYTSSAKDVLDVDVLLAG